MSLRTYHTIGRNKNAPRVFIESARLAALGFTPGTRIAIDQLAGNKIMLKPARTAARGLSRPVTVSKRKVAGAYRPIIDLNSFSRLARLADFEEACVCGSFGSLSISPSIRAFNIAMGKQGRSTYRVLDVFCGGGTASDAFSNPRFKVVAGIELQPTYADEFSRKHPDAEVIIGDLRKMHPSELPEFDGLFCGIPCTSHSKVARASKGLAGRPELGDTGDLFIPVLGLIAARMPAFVVLENVPPFATDLAGETIKEHLRRLGYHVSEAILDPHGDYAEPSTRDRWICVAVLHGEFDIPNPETPFTGTLEDFLDPVDPHQDKADALRIQATIECLKRHTAKHLAMGHSFRLQVLPRSAKSIPTILKSYHKINTSGAFIRTPYGPRMIRPEELCRIHGHTFTSTDASSIYQMSGQGVQTRIFRLIMDSLAAFLP